MPWRTRVRTQRSISASGVIPNVPMRFWHTGDRSSDDGSQLRHRSWLSHGSSRE
jgi:hypothetical protein